MLNGLHYLDLETGGLSPRTDPIITIQSAHLSHLYRSEAEVTIRAEWEAPGKEKEIIQSFFIDSNFLNSKWQFVPVGFNLMFEMRFLWNRAAYHGLLNPMVTPFEQFIDRPMLDMQPLAVFWNELEFKGASLKNYSAKPVSGTDIPKYYKERRYDAIRAYVESETRSALDLFWAVADTSGSYWKTSVAPLLGLEQKGVVLP